MAVALSFAATACGSQTTTDLAQKVKIEGDSIPASLTGHPGNMTAGEISFASREDGHCVLCHAIKGLDAEFQGNVGPDLTGVAARLSPGQIRYRIVDAQGIWPETVMPSYFRIDGLRQVGAEYEGEPALTAQQIEDLVAFLSAQGN